MKTAKNVSPDRPRKWLAPALMAGILVVLFWKSFLPDYVHFANDGPLGQQNAAYMQFPGNFTAIWGDLNELGSSGGSATPTITTVLRWWLGPLGYAKYLAPITLWILGLCVWFFFRQLRFSNLAATLGGLAGMFVTTSFSDACWGVASHEVAIGMDFCALGLFAGNAYEPSALRRWLRLAVAGLAVGVNVIEAADIGAILSVFVAFFVLFLSLVEENGSFPVRLGRGIARVAVIAAFAGIIALQTVLSLVNTSVTGIAGTRQDAETKMQQWDFATQWSLPKKETLGLFVPGLFGYRMDTPKDMARPFQHAYDSGHYWGGIGRTPAIDRYFDSGGKDSPPGGIMRFSGTGEYIGILVLFIALWTIAQSFRGQNSVFPAPQRKFILMGAALLVFSLLMAWGRFAPFFYGTFYQLPYASTIRNPAKFLIIFAFVAVILFGYGIQGLWRLYLQPNAPSSTLASWWARVRGFDRRWTIFSAGAVLFSLVALFIYASEKTALIKYLKMVQTPMPESAAAFSIGQGAWFVVTFALSAGLLVLIVAGVFSGKSSQFGGLLLGSLLVVDMGRANLPWIIHWDYKQKYEVGSLNPIVDLLRQKPYEHRLAYGLPTPLGTPPDFQTFAELWGIEWMQHLFPYYNIQTLDVVQRPRMPVDLEAFEKNFQLGFRSENGQLGIDPATFPRVNRLWQLTNTRYLVGPTDLVNFYNSQFDPEQHRYRILQRFNIALKPGVLQFHQRLEEITVTPDDNGPYALFEFTGALPRVKLYAHWETNSATDVAHFTTNGLSGDELTVFYDAGTNGFLTLKKLGSPSFDPAQTVLLDAPIAAGPGSPVDAGTVDFESYAPTHIKLKAHATAPAVLLFSDKFDPGWHVSVDGQSAPLLHANFIMRGVFLSPGDHAVEFRYSLPNGPIRVTLFSMGVGVVLLGSLLISRRKPQAPANTKSP